MDGESSSRRPRVATALNLALAGSGSENDGDSWIQDDSVPNNDQQTQQVIGPSVTDTFSPARDRPYQRRAASANQVPALASTEQVSTTSTFESPLRSILVSSPPTASVSANTALASLSAATTTRSSSGPFAGLASASTRRIATRSEDVMSPPSASGRQPVLTLEKDLDDPDSTSAAVHDSYALNTTLSRLFVSSEATSPGLSRLPSHLRTLSAIGRSLNDTTTLTGHLFHRGFAEGRHSDITIVAFGERYKLHKLLLDRVPFFASAFSGPWAESLATEMQLHPEEIDNNISKGAFELALKRIYGTPSTTQEDHEALSLFATACWLNLPDLVESCVDAMLRQMQPSSLHELIRLVTTNYYGKAGDRILASAKAMLCREGWEMEYANWDHIPSEMIREVIGGDPFFVPTEWERWFLATKILNRKLRAKATEAGLISDEGAFLYPRPGSLRFFAVRFDATYRRQSGYSAAHNISEKDAPWVSLYTSPDVAPLLVLLDEGVHYMHLRFEQLQQIRSHKDIFGVPVLPEKVISDALWMSMELRQRVLNAHEDDMDLDLAHTATDDYSAEPQSSQSANEKGKQPVQDFEQDEDLESESWDGNAHPRKFWIPVDDVSCVMGGTREAHAAAAAAAPATWRIQTESRLSASLEPTDVTWASDFVLDNGRPLSRNLNNAAPPQYTHFPPFRFSAEFPNPRSLKDKKRIYSKTFWYAGSMWNVYIQRIANSKNQQMGIYLHRAKDNAPTDDPHGLTVSASVDDRIGQLEREMLLRKEGRRRPWQDTGAGNTLAGAIPDGNNAQSDHAIDRARKEARSPEFWSDSLRSTATNVSRLFDSDEEDEELLRANRKNSVPTMPPYLDSRPMIKTYFKIYSPDKAGRLLSIYESAPEKFVVSKSWGWKSSQMLPDDGSLGYDMTRSSKSSNLRYMVVIGNV